MVYWQTTHPGSGLFSASSKSDLTSIYPIAKLSLDHEPLNFSPLPEIYASALPSGLPKEFDTPENRLLARRLDSFLRRPIETLDQAQGANFDGCPADISDKLVNQDQLRGESDFWTALSTNDIVQRRVEIVRELEEKVLKGVSVVFDGVSTGRGRGIVLTAGNRDTVERSKFLLKQLKRVGVTLPVEVFHFPGEFGDWQERREIERLGGTVKAVQGLEKEENLWKNFHLKGLAIVQSSFQEVLYLDSDNVPLRDPSHLFDGPLYIAHGRAAFWPDLYKDHPSNAIWRLVGQQCTLDHWTIESGQLVVDKGGNHGLNYAALLIAAYMQRSHEFWFHMAGGDKDTFRWAFEILGLTWAHPSRWMSSLGMLNDWDADRFCGHSIVQYDLVESVNERKALPLFIHSNLLKHLLDFGIGRGHLFSHIKRPLNDSYSSPALNHFRMDVYTSPSRGLCTDMKIQPSAVKHLTPQELKGLEVQMQSVKDVPANPFEGFEDAYWDGGGRMGGW
ncbi:mannosyltransferase putative-domain-containing protein [Kockovaella imperatae]|uniref:Mannosyltransferase putative-domain-containing protein n=1 Tax=Kockovaella imperatae TaxID=4999 RepID=A0A1Y1UNF7_9TREE|nr:mannosyltransferase putative-domain-containing protein [Kockovaella imperatae]ORX39591.1 mannosyltransferase putative-domain-containing protein [Kockovaella imperatae]